MVEAIDSSILNMRTGRTAILTKLWGWMKLMASLSLSLSDPLYRNKTNFSLITI